jgi:hypothetical protein
MSPKQRLFWIVWTAGMAGALSLLLLDLSAVIAALPRPPGAPALELPPPALLKVASVVQSAVIVTLAALAGVWLAGRVGLHAPAAEAAARGERFFRALRPQIGPGVLAGLAAGIAIAGSWIVAQPFLTPEFVGRAQDFNKITPHAVRLLYGGITEEVLLRWGVMTFLVWAAWRLGQKGAGPPKPAFFAGAIVLSAVIFGAGHLPVASMLNGGLTTPVVIYVVTGNAIFGLVAGWLYWKKGLEAAIVAHMSTHLVLIAAISFSF